MIRNLVFDMGGVLMDFHPLAACRKVAPDEDAAQKLNEALFRHPEWGRLDDDSITPEALARLAMDALDDDALKPLVQKLFDGMPWNILSPIKGMEAVVDRAMSDGYHVYLLSNAGRKISEHREIIPLIHRFDGVIFSVEERTKKPGPAIYTQLTSFYGLKPEECLFIDDDPGNVEAARALGWHGYRFDGNVAALSAALEQLPKPETPD
ncbi:MAG: HAD family phosphatase [Eubacteriales bacterium]|nr:HAD family phosphatase [Eubacteriales bacterium]